MSTRSSAAASLLASRPGFSTSNESASCGEAVAREQYVVSQVNSGTWSPSTYYEYLQLHGVVLKTDARDDVDVFHHDARVGLGDHVPGLWSSLWRRAYGHVG